MNGEQTQDVAVQAVEAVKESFQQIGACLRSRCAAPPDVVDGLRFAGRTFDELGTTFSALDDRLYAAGFNRLGADCEEFSAHLSIALAGGDDGGPRNIAIARQPLRRLTRALAQLAASFDGVTFARGDQFQAAFQPLQAGVAELVFIDGILDGVAPGQPLSALLPFTVPAVAGLGQSFLETAALVPLGVGIPFFDPICPDLCAGCPAAISPRYVFTGRFVISPAPGAANQVIVDPLFSTIACCRVSCAGISSRCDRVVVEKAVTVPGVGTTTNRPGNIAVVQGQIRAMIRNGKIAAPIFAAGDCP